MNETEILIQVPNGEAGDDILLVQFALTRTLISNISIRGGNEEIELIIPGEPGILLMRGGIQPESTLRLAVEWTGEAPSAVEILWRSLQELGILFDSFEFGLRKAIDTHRLSSPANALVVDWNALANGQEFKKKVKDGKDKRIPFMVAFDLYSNPLFRPSTRDKPWHMSIFDTQSKLHDWLYSQLKKRWEFGGESVVADENGDLKLKVDTVACVNGVIQDAGLRRHEIETWSHILLNEVPKAAFGAAWDQSLDVLEDCWRRFASSSSVVDLVVPVNSVLKKSLDHKFGYPDSGFVFLIAELAIAAVILDTQYKAAWLFLLPSIIEGELLFRSTFRDANQNQVGLASNLSKPISELSFTFDDMADLKTVAVGAHVFSGYYEADLLPVHKLARRYEGDVARLAALHALIFYQCCPGGGPT